MPQESVEKEYKIDPETLASTEMARDVKSGKKTTIKRRPDGTKEVEITADANFVREMYYSKDGARKTELRIINSKTGKLFKKYRYDKRGEQLLEEIV